MVKNIPLLLIGQNAIVREVSDYRSLRIIILRAKNYLMDELGVSEEGYRVQLGRMIEYVGVWMNSSVVGNDSRNELTDEDLGLFHVSNDFVTNIVDELCNII
jgi:hypothetical protein